MKRFLAIVILLVPFILLDATKEGKEELIKTEGHQEELTSKKEVAQKVVPSRRITIFSHAASLAVPVILFLLYLYFFKDWDVVPEGFFGDGWLNMVIFSILFSVSGFYFYLYLEAFLAKKMPSAIGKFFSGLISLYLSIWMMAFLLCLFSKAIPSDVYEHEGLPDLFTTALVWSLYNSLFSWFIYKGINRFFH